VGEVVEGQVATLQPYGAFINLGDNMNGLLHISQISHDRISSVEQVLQVGQKVKVGPPPASHALLITLCRPHRKTGKMQKRLHFMEEIDIRVLWSFERDICMAACPNAVCCCHCPGGATVNVCITLNGWCFKGGF
jgi:hypothetical protein